MLVQLGCLLDTIWREKNLRSENGVADAETGVVDAENDVADAENGLADAEDDVAG